jgi:sterol desaturase/sphingolipid hydroxylase (fatty acid hydroxylase superfamily)
MLLEFFNLHSNTIEIQSIWDWLLLLILADFFYYVLHFFQHRFSFFWASHFTHHTIKQINLINGMRLSWMTLASGSILIFTPLVLIGYNPRDVMNSLFIIVFYQFFLHTEFVGQLRWFDRIFNTPSNHRVHHHINSIGKNLGGILIVFDIFFKTYQAETSRSQNAYGVENFQSNNIFKIVFWEWSRLFKNLLKKLL